MSASELTNTGELPTPSASQGGVLTAIWRGVLRLFSSIWLGISLLVFLFVYSTIGSVGVWVPGIYGDLALRHEWIHEIYWIIPWTQMHVRQSPAIELNEFEWFHWWPFNLNIALICVNLAVASIRRIPFNVVNLGVWMIHSGIIILCIGSVIYFTTKLEGEVPIMRRMLTIEVPDHPPVSVPAQPGAMKMIETDQGIYHFNISRVDPQWEMLSGEASGERAYAVMVNVRTPSEQFIRTLPAGYPEHVQDAVATDDPEQPFSRAINVIGRAIVDDDVKLTLDYAPESYFYRASLMEFAALYLREKGSTEWVERPIHGLPRYNNYVQSPSEVWNGADEELIQPRDLDIDVHAVADDDPLADVPISVTRYLRYARETTHRMPGGSQLDPVALVRLQFDRGQSRDYELVAFDPDRQTAESGRLAFHWADSSDDFEMLAQSQPPRLSISVPSEDIAVTDIIQPPSGDGDGFVAIEGTDFSYRVERIERDLQLQSGQSISVAVVTIRTPERTFQRWVMNNPNLPQRDVAIDSDDAMHNGELPFDDRIEMQFLPGRRAALVTVIAGPSEEQLSLLLQVPGEEASIQPLRAGQNVSLQQGITMQVVKFAARSWEETRPELVPPHRRQRNAGQQRSMIRIDLPVAGGTSLWLPFHVYPFDSRDDVMRRFAYQPRDIALPDGRVIEVIYSRQREPLPTRVALHDFRVSSHIGGFTGESSSIRDWTSIVRFDRDSEWTEPEPISMNKPANHEGYWFFQAKWDPPDGPRWEGDPPSAGLNYTVLGVGNRNGVWTQLIGCIIAVIGMCYAFYVKPIIKRRRQQAVYERVRVEQASLHHASEVEDAR